MRARQVLARNLCSPLFAFASYSFAFASHSFALASIHLLSLRLVFALASHLAGPCFASSANPRSIMPYMNIPGQVWRDPRLVRAQHHRRHRDLSRWMASFMSRQTVDHLSRPTTSRSVSYLCRPPTSLGLLSLSVNGLPFYPLVTTASRSRHTKHILFAPHPGKTLTRPPVGPPDSRFETTSRRAVLRLQIVQPL